MRTLVPGREGKRGGAPSDSEDMDEDEWAATLGGNAYDHLAQRLAPTSKKKLKTVSTISTVFSAACRRGLSSLSRDDRAT